MTNQPHSSFNSQWDLDSKHAVPESNEAQVVSQNILESLKKRRGAETAQWLNNLNIETKSTTSQQGLSPVTMSPEEQTEHELTRWLDKLFDQLDLYAAQFNRTAQGTDLLATCTRPKTDTPKQAALYDDPEEKGPTVPLHEGHLVTRFWAMYISGSAGIVKVFIFPAEVLLGFSLHRIDESIYSPLLVLESQWQNDKLIWHIAGTNVVTGQVSALAKELFGDLIRVASGQMSETELFAHPLQEMNLGENVAVGYKTPEQPSAAPATLPPVNPAAPEVAQVNPNKGPFVLAVVDLAQPLVASIEADLKLLFDLGKAALAADDTLAFRNIKTLTEKMETLKAAISAGFSEIAHITNSDTTAK